MKLYNSKTNKVEDFKPLDDNKVKMYVCGPTVYDFAHLGHARCYITWDMVYRYLMFKGYEVIYARNITDVDDKIIARAKAENSTPDKVAKKYYEEFKKSMEALNILQPDIEPKATETIDEMLNIIKNLEDNGFAYSVDGDVYFRVEKYKKYGSLSGQNIDDLVSGARIEENVQKENPLDFALWKKDEENGWDSPYGKGRPGWHIECSAMIKKHLGTTIDIHAGGADLLFPHHENEQAQSECAFGCEFVNYWLHNGFVKINNEKMSKSLGNFITINDILKKYDADTIRFFILTNHYRMPVEFTDEALKSAKAGVKRLKNAIGDVMRHPEDGDEVDGREDLIIRDSYANAQNDKFIKAMDNDFNSSKALAVLFELASEAQKIKNTDNQKAKELIMTLIKLSKVLGFKLDEQNELGSELVGALVDLIIDVRKIARTEKNWAISDTIRDELKLLGITLKDTQNGTSWTMGDD